MPYGMELEYEGRSPLEIKANLWDCGYPYRWKVVGDGSLSNGAEFVTGVHTADVVEEEACKLIIAKAEKNWPLRTSERTGIHIHVSPPEWIVEIGQKRDWLFWMAKIFATHHEALKKRFCLTKERERWCYGPPQKGYDFERMAKLSYRDLAVTLQCGAWEGRYHGFNWHAIDKFGTVELRYFDSTLDVNKICQYVEAAKTINHCAAEGRVPELAELFPWDDELVSAWKAGIAPTVKSDGGWVGPKEWKPCREETIEAVRDSPRKRNLIERLTDQFLLGWDGNMNEIDLLGADRAREIKSIRVAVRTVWWLLSQTNRYRDLYNNNHGGCHLERVGIYGRTWCDILYSRLQDRPEVKLGRSYCWTDLNFEDFFAKIVGHARSEARDKIGDALIAQRPEDFGKKVSFQYTQHWAKPAEPVPAPSKSIARSAKAFENMVGKYLKDIPTDK